MEKTFIEHILKEVSEFQKVVLPKDELTRLIEKYDDEEDELAGEEMELITAASGMTYMDFLKRIKELN